MQTLIDRFKDFNQKKRTAQSESGENGSSGSRKVFNKLPGAHRSDSFQPPLIPPGEDEAPYERHNRVLCAEWGKASRNAAVIEQLMGLSFALRRRDIMKGMDLITIFSNFPFLQESQQVSNHVCHLVELVHNYKLYVMLNHHL